MTVSEKRPYEWRTGTVQLGSKLDSAHCAVEDLGSALDDGDSAAARSIARSALGAVGSVNDAVDAMRAERPPDARLSEPDAIGSMLAIGGSEVASVALDVMVNAMVALAATDDDGDEDFLIGACVDAASAYEVGAAVVETAPRWNGPGILDLKRAFEAEAEGESAIGTRLTRTRARVDEINRQTGSGVLGGL